MGVNWKKNVVTKKGWKWLNDARRLALGSGNATNALVINSIPKSGTYLLHQVVEPLGLKDWGGFLATTPSVTLKKRSAPSHRWLLDRLFDRELLTGHIFFDGSVEGHLQRLETPMIFIVRDPRDIFLSEIDYLSVMNRWHRVHRHYSRLSDFHDAFNLCLNGLEQRQEIYPSFDKRIEPYLGWLNSEACLTVRFERLIDEKHREQEISRIYDYTAHWGLHSLEAGEFLDRAVSSMLPQRSHTYNERSNGDWQSRLSDDQAKRLTESLGSVLREMGYAGA